MPRRASFHLDLRSPSHCACVARRSLTAKEEEIAKLRKAYDKSERDIKALQVRHVAPCPHAVELRA